MAATEYVPFKEGELMMDLPQFSDSDEEDEDARLREKYDCRESAYDRLERFRRRLKQALDNLPRHGHSERKLAENSSFFQSLLSAEDSDNLERRQVTDFTNEEFHEQYVSPSVPVMLTGIPEAGKWRALERWNSLETFVQHYGNMELKVTELVPFHGFGKPMPVRLPLDCYADYCNTTTVDSPLYCFERELTETRAQLLDDYAPPPFFTDDLLDLSPAARSCLPQHKYFICGGQRSGSNMHTDPVFTGAWNTLLHGHKKWALFPPGQAAAYKEAIGVPDKDTKHNAPAYWWLDTYSRLKSSGQGKELGMIECVQGPGETIFVPAGWWHVVLNLDFTIAITQNLLPPSSLASLWKDIEVYEDFAIWFAKTLRHFRPELLKKYPKIALFLEQKDDLQPFDELAAPFADKA